MFGLRTVEHAAAARLRAAGHRVALPDLFDGAVAAHGGPPILEDGVNLMETIGWEAIVTRPIRPCVTCPPTPSFAGCRWVPEWSARYGPSDSMQPPPFLHAPTIVPRGVRPGTPVQVHVADEDPFAPADQLAAFQDSAMRADVDAALYTYPGAGHFFTDAELPDHNRSAAEEAWRRVGALLDTVR